MSHRPTKWRCLTDTTEISGINMYFCMVWLNPWALTSAKCTSDSLTEINPYVGYLYKNKTRAVGAVIVVLYGWAFCGLTEIQTAWTLTRFKGISKTWIWKILQKTWDLGQSHEIKTGQKHAYFTLKVAWYIFIWAGEYSSNACSHVQFAWS